jgi:predicted HTH transcriptional regulator
MNKNQNNKNIELKSIKKVLNAFKKNKAYTCRGLSNNLNLNYYTIKSVLDFLLSENKIQKLNATNRGVLFIKNDSNKL